MGVKLLDATMALVANQFNPSVLNPRWVGETLGLLEDDFRDFAFSPAFAQIVNERFTLLMVPERLQFAPRVARDQQQALLEDKVGRLVKALPHTPYLGLGLNFSYRYTPENADVRALSRQLFFVPGSELHQAFDSTDARFGGYVSREALGGRMKVDIKPNFTKVIATQKEEHYLALEFNFHYDLSAASSATNEIMSALSKWNEALEVAEKTVHLVAEKGGSK